MLLAGGAWSSLFCRRHGIDLPIGLVDATACRTTAAPEITAGALGTTEYCIRRRLDGGFTLALRGRGTVNLTPDLMRYAKAFWPTYLHRRKGLKLRLGTAFFKQLMSNAYWSLDAASPFEAVRVQDPAPDMSLVNAALDALITSNPNLAGIKIAEAWGGTIDSTPDTVPVISDVEQLPGFFLATGFSGHGFGIGPAAGKLALHACVSERQRDLASREREVEKATEADQGWNGAWAKTCSACWLREGGKLPTLATVREILAAITEIGPVLEKKASLVDRPARWRRIRPHSAMKPKRWPARWGSLLGRYPGSGTAVSACYRIDR